MLLSVSLVAPQTASATFSDGTEARCNVNVANQTYGASFQWWATCSFSDGYRIWRSTSSLGPLFGFGLRCTASDGTIGWISQVGASTDIGDFDSSTDKLTHTSTWGAQAANVCRTAAGGAIASPLASISLSTSVPQARAVVNRSSGSTQTTGPAVRVCTEANGWITETCSGHKAKLVTVQVASGYPAFPGAPTTPQKANCAVLKEERGDGFYRARLRVTVTNPEGGRTDTITADHGDTNSDETPVTNVPYWHYFTTPTAGQAFTVVYTIASTGQEGSNITCTLSVNFFDDELDTAEGGGETEVDDGEGDEEVTESCGFFDVVCWLKKLFIPNGDAIADAAGDLSDAAGENWPLGPVLQGVDDVTGIDDDVVEGSDEDQDLVDDQTVTNPGNGCSALGVPLRLNPADPDDVTNMNVLDGCPPGVDYRASTRCVRVAA